MKKRTAFIGAILSLMPLGQSFLIRTTVVFSTSAIISFHSEKVQAESASFYFNLGREKSLKDDYPQSIKEYSKAIQKNPNYADAYFFRGLSQGRLGNHQEALEDFTRVIELNPKDANAYYNRGIAKEKLDDKKGFCLDVQKALSLGFKEEDKKLVEKNCY